MVPAGHGERKLRWRSEEGSSLGRVVVDGSLLLTRQLVEITALAQALGQCGRQSAAAHFYRQLCNRASLHVLARERLVLPAWRRAGWKHLASDGLRAYVDFKRALAELLVAPPGQPGFAGALAAFLRAVAAQKREDERQLVPALRKGLDLTDRRTVFNEVEALYDSDEPGADAAEALPAGDGPPGRALVEEAELVLSSLAAGAAGGRPGARAAPRS